MSEQGLWNTKRPESTTRAPNRQNPKKKKHGSQSPLFKCLSQSPSTRASLCKSKRRTNRKIMVKLRNRKFNKRLNLKNRKLNNKRNKLQKTLFPKMPLYTKLQNWNLWLNTLKTLKKFKWYSHLWPLCKNQRSLILTRISHQRWHSTRLRSTLILRFWPKRIKRKLRFRKRYLT